MAEHQRPSIGRLVLFRSGVGMEVKAEAPAIITGVQNDTTVDLMVFRNFGAPFHARDVPFVDHEINPRLAAGYLQTWRWPPRV